MADALVFDDDAAVGGLITKLLETLGYSAEHHLTGKDVPQLVQRSGCKLVILDIMMPEMDGLSACRAIRANPATKNVKIAVITAKDFEEDRNKAKKLGADLFINKPFELSDLGKALKGLIETPQAPGAAMPTPPITLTVSTGMAALELENFWIVFDAGAGLRSYIADHTPPALCWVLFSRFEQPAKSEIESLSILRSEKTDIRIAGPADADSTLQSWASQVFGEKSREQKSLPSVYPLREGDVHLEPYINGTCKYTRHPGTALAYRLDVQGRSIVYCPANEIVPEMKLWNQQEAARFKTFVDKASVLIHGFWRSVDDPKPQDDSQRSAWEPIVDIAVESEVKNLVLVPFGDASRIEEFRAKAAERVGQRQTKMRLAIAQPHSQVLL